MCAKALGVVIVEARGISWTAACTMRQTDLNGLQWRSVADQPSHLPVDYCTFWP